MATEQISQYETTLKLVVPLIGVLIGWMLGLGSNFILLWWKRRELKKALITELYGLHETLENYHLSYARDLQVAAVGQVSRSTQIKLTHPIYEHHYKDVCNYLSQSQRRSYELIHEQINSYNKRREEEELAIAAHSNKPSKETFIRWGSSIEAQYLNVRTIHWHITHHLNHRANPELKNGTQIHKRYLDFLQEAEDDAKTIFTKAKSFDPSDIKKKYQESQFEDSDKS